MSSTTRSGRQRKAPLPADRVRTFAPKGQVATEPDIDDNQVMCYLLFALQSLLIVKGL